MGENSHNLVTLTKSVYAASVLNENRRISAQHCKRLNGLVLVQCDQIGINFALELNFAHFFVEFCTKNIQGETFFKQASM
jgi:hypothetical protein